MSESPHTVFISYSWDTPEHEQWVTQLAIALEQEPELHVIFDKFDLWAGRDLTHFMEHSLLAERIVIVSTPPYLVKASTRVGGVGYECSIITGELARRQDHDKFIPVLRAGTETPSFLRSRVYVDAREPIGLSKVVSDILGAVRRQGTVKRPEKRTNVTTSVPTAPAERVREGSWQPLDRDSAADTLPDLRVSVAADEDRVLYVDNIGLAVAPAATLSVLLGDSFAPQTCQFGAIAPGERIRVEGLIPGTFIRASEPTVVGRVTIAYALTSRRDYWTSIDYDLARAANGGLYVRRIPQRPISSGA